MGIVSRIRDALKRAQGDVDALQAKVGYWAQIVEAKRGELAELDASVGKRVADDESGRALEEYGATRYGLDAQIEAARRTVEEFEGRLRTAQTDLKAAQAAETRERAAAVRAEAQKRQARVDELLGQLEEFEGGGWRPWQPSHEEVVQAGAAGIRLTPPKTPPMFAQADELDRQASALEEQVAAERRQAAVIQPNALIHWDGRHYKGAWRVRVQGGVNDGVGTVSFEVTKNGQTVWSRVLPDGSDRDFREYVDGFADDVIEIRADGRVLAVSEVELPPGSFNDGRGRASIAPVYQ